MHLLLVTRHLQKSGQTAGTRRSASWTWRQSKSIVKSAVCRCFFRTRNKLCCQWPTSIDTAIQAFGLARYELNNWIQEIMNLIIFSCWISVLISVLLCADPIHNDRLIWKKKVELRSSVCKLRPVHTHPQLPRIRNFLFGDTATANTHPG